MQYCSVDSVVRCRLGEERVTMWLPQSLHDLLGDDLDQIDWTALQSLIGASEGEELEFKQEMWSQGRNEELARDIAQYANQRGGMIVIGAQEVDGKLAGFVPLELTEADELRIQEIVASRISPRPEIHTKRIAANSNSFEPTTHILLISAPSSHLKPHAVKENRGFSYPIRSGSRKHYLNETEISDHYARRQTNHEQIHGRLGALVDSASAELDGSTLSQSALVCAAVPEQGGQANLTSDSARDIQRYTIEAFVPQNDWNLHKAQSGFRSIRFEPQSGTTAVFEFSVDGSGYAVDGLDFGEQGELKAERIALSALNCLSLFSRHALESGAIGSLFYSCRLIGDRDRMVGLRTSPQYGRLGWKPIRLPTPIAERSFPIAALANGGSALLSAWQLVASDLMSPFGFATPILVDSTGRLMHNSYLSPWRSDFNRLAIPIADT